MWTATIQEPSKVRSPEVFEFKVIFVDGTKFKFEKIYKVPADMINNIEDVRSVVEADLSRLTKLSSLRQDLLRAIESRPV